MIQQLSTFRHYWWFFVTCCWCIQCESVCENSMALLSQAHPLPGHEFNQALSSFNVGPFQRWSPNLFFKTLCILTRAAGADPGFGQGGAPASEAESCRCSEAEYMSEASILRQGSRACLRALEVFRFLMLKYAFSHILETLFLLFLTSILTPKVDKNRALDFTSINLRHSDMLHLFFNLHEKVML